VDIGLSNNGGANAVRVRSPTWIVDAEAGVDQDWLLRHEQEGVDGEYADAGSVRLAGRT
jgi:hypothetical protein